MDEWQDAAQRAVEAIEELIALQDEYQENLYSRSGIIAHRSGRFGIHKVYFPSLAAVVGLVHETESIPLAAYFWFGARTPDLASEPAIQLHSFEDNRPWRH